LSLRRDDEITGDVIAALGATPQVKETSVLVNTRNRRVILSGAVDTYGEKLAAEEIARGIPGVKAVENDLAVAVERETSDQEIEGCILKRLSDIPELSGVGIRSKQGDVVLMGKLPSLALEQRALDEAASVRGVGAVVSDIEIAPGMPIDDVTMANDVTEALSDDPRLYLQNMDIRAADGFVDLWGEAPDERQASIAVEVAAAVPGVQRIESHIVVRETNVPRGAGVGTPTDMRDVLRSEGES
jgi:osmotically-inducible protein OsmY